MNCRIRFDFLTFFSWFVALFYLFALCFSPTSKACGLVFNGGNQFVQLFLQESLFSFNHFLKIFKTFCFQCRIRGTLSFSPPRFVVVLVLLHRHLAWISKALRFSLQRQTLLLVSHCFHEPLCPQWLFPLYIFQLQLYILVEFSMSSLIFPLVSLH